MGSFASFTCGMLHNNGGFAAESGSPADNNFFVGFKNQDNKIHYLPFFKSTKSDAERYVQENQAQNLEGFIYKEKDINRSYEWATDAFSTDQIQFKIQTPFFNIPDPSLASQDKLKEASCPSIFMELIINNTSSGSYEGFFALENNQRWSPLSSKEKHLKGMISRDSFGFATDNTDVEEFIDFDVSRALSNAHTTPHFLIAPVGGFKFHVAAGESKTIRICMGNYLAGNIVFNREMSYWYTRHFEGIQEVLTYALENYDLYQKISFKRDEELNHSCLNEDQKFLIAHATRSYFGSTQWLCENDKPVWIVNEGEYVMMNTLDLTIDMLFFELKWNPWTVRNVLEHFVENYSYTDRIFSPEAPEKTFEGGISFAHDMGVANHFSPDGYSSYECSGLDRKCFSYMTGEQLTNWILIAGVYFAKTQDQNFLNTHSQVLKDCLDSLLNRDNPVPQKRDGLIHYESTRTEGGGEITTYDSLDHSLGQARNNIYLGGKCWASSIALEHLFHALGDTERESIAKEAAARSADTLSKAFDPKLGFIPAVLEEGNKSCIIPAVEALIYPWEMGLKNKTQIDGEYSEYIQVLFKHIQHCMQPGVCLYEDGGWKLSNSADNSWMSKICLSQHILREIMNFNYEGERKSDEAHANWEIFGSTSQACSDQFTSGQAMGSLYYPRIVTNILWLSENN